MNVRDRVCVVTGVAISESPTSAPSLDRHDRVVPLANAESLHERLPNSITGSRP